MKLLPGGDKLITWGEADNSLHERDATTGLETQSWSGPASLLLGFGLSPDGRNGLAMGEGTEVIARNLSERSSAKLPLKMEPALGLLGVAFSPNGKLFAVAGSGVAEAWETASWQRVATLGGYVKGVNALTFSPDGRRLATGSSDHDAIRLWSVENWQDVLTLDGSGFFNLPTFSPDGNVLGAAVRNFPSGTAQGFENFLRLWRAPSWEDIAAADARESE